MDIALRGSNALRQVSDSNIQDKFWVFNQLRLLIPKYLSRYSPTASSVLVTDIFFQDDFSFSSSYYLSAAPTQFLRFVSYHAD